MHKAGEGRERLILPSSGSLFDHGIARVSELAAGEGFDGIEVLIDHRWDTRPSQGSSRMWGTSIYPI